ncbi:MAG: serine/threonine protein kinase, partial [bacterium]|nr:serine/threonine protein kinase [bacterium]
PATLKLEPGSYVLTVQREGYVPWNEQVEVKPGDTTRRRISLDPLASGTGFTLVSEPAGAQALLDGRALEGMTPLKVQSVMPGKHKIEVKTATGSWQQEVTIEAGKMLEVRATIAMAAKTPAASDKDKLAAKAADKTPATQPQKTPPVVAAVQKTADKQPVTPSVAPKSKEPDPARDKAKTPDKSAAAAAEPKKSKQPDLTMPDEDKPKKVASADKPPVEKSPVEKSPEKSSAPSSSGDGWLRLGSKPWTNIVVDGKETGLHTPQTHLKLAAGSHRITLTNPQFSIKETFSVDIKSGETETVIKDLRPQGNDSD